MNDQTSQGQRAGSKMLNLHVEDRDQLYASYMPFIENGGLFVKTPDFYELGDEIFLLVTLMDDSERFPVAGRIAWITPKDAVGGRVPGIGVQFSDQDNGKLRSRIETLLAGLLKADRPTYTM